MDRVSDTTMFEVRTDTFERHAKLPAGGPWVDEPDKVQWVDDATGLDCLIVRNHLGALCGYVGVSRQHRCFGKRYDDLGDVDVHGGLTFADACHEGGPVEAICHVPYPGRDGDVWWFGFDCAHYLDEVPLMYEGLPDDLKHQLTAGSPLPVFYKTIGYVQAECASLAEQLAELADP